MPQEIYTAMIPLDKIVPSKTNPRKSFDEEKLKELAASITERGQVVPILVRPLGTAFELVNGERRYRATKMLQLPEILATVREMTDDEAKEAQLIDFINSEDITPLEMAEAMERYAASLKGKATNKQIAAKFGKPVRFVAEHRALSGLLPSFRKMLEAGEMSIRNAVEMSKYSLATQSAVYKANHQRQWFFEDDDDFDRMMENYVRPLNEAPFDINDPTIVTSAGACSTCLTRTGNNLELFASGKKNDRCMNAVCFVKKVDNHIAASVRIAEDEGKPFVQVSADYSQVPKGLIGKSEYREGGKTRAIVVHGEKDERGKIINITLNKEAAKTVKAGSGDNGPSDAERREKWKRRMEIYGNKVEMDARQEMVVALLHNMTDFTADDLRPVVEWMLENRFHLKFQDSVVATGLKLDPDKGLDNGKPQTTAFLKAAKPLQLVKAIIGLFLTSTQMIDDPSMHAATDEDAEALLSACKRYGVPIAEIRRAADKRRQGEKPKAFVPTPKPATKPAPKKGKTP